MKGLSKGIKRRVQSLGGKAVISKVPPNECPRCGSSMQGRTWHSYLGHLGIHGLADHYFDGDVKAAQKRLRENGTARQDPFPGNGAWRPYQPVTAQGSIGRGREEIIHEREG